MKGQEKDVVMGEVWWMHSQAAGRRHRSPLAESERQAEGGGKCRGSGVKASCEIINLVFVLGYTLTLEFKGNRMTPTSDVGLTACSAMYQLCLRHCSGSWGSDTFLSLGISELRRGKQMVDHGGT